MRLQFDGLDVMHRFRIEATEEAFIKTLEALHRDTWLRGENPLLRSYAPSVDAPWEHLYEGGAASCWMLRRADSATEYAIKLYITDPGYGWLLVIAYCLRDEVAVLEQLIECLRLIWPDVALFNAVSAPDVTEPHIPSDLRGRNREILKRYLSGMDARQIANDLFIQPHSVDNRLSELRSRYTPSVVPYRSHSRTNSKGS